MRWVVGPAGVGKTAIMQIVAEETPADASVFFSVSGRRDGTKTFTTIAYQLAAKCELYCQFIRKEISRDPTLLTKALPSQFQKFIVEPFIHQHLFNPSNRFLVIIDGLDECDNPLIQRELLELISEFCLAYPTSPVVWFIASRPEPHITSFFDDVSVVPAYAKEEIIVDSDEACEDVQLYLRNELNKIKRAYPTLRRKREWPSELEFTQIASAAGGLFAYASTVVRYIGDPYYRDPVALLHHVFEAIDASPEDDASGKEHPMVPLDALYQRIFSNIPADVMIHTRKLLLINSKYGRIEENFRPHCNRLGLTEDAACGAVSHLHAVVKIPAPDEADDERLECFHKSFSDFLFDFKRSGFCHNIADEVEQLLVQSSLRIVKQVPDDFDNMASDEGVESRIYGCLKGDPGFCDNISLSWPGDERFLITDTQLRLNLYRTSMFDMCRRFRSHSKFYWNLPVFNLLTTRFIVPDTEFPFYELRDFAFVSFSIVYPNPDTEATYQDDFRHELTELGGLKQVPLRALDYAAICGRIDLSFTSRIIMDGKHSDTWDRSCEVSFVYDCRVHRT
jgi:hypothetical protein